MFAYPFGQGVLSAIKENICDKISQHKNKFLIATL